MNAATAEPRLAAGQLLAYAAPAVALQAMMVPLLLTLPPFYSLEVGMSLQLVGAMFMLARLWEAVTDPLIGAWSDRTRSRFGPRRPWMAAGVPVALVSAWFLLNPPAGAGPMWLLAWLMAFYLGWTMVYIPYQSWGAEIATGFEERTRVAGFREGGSFAGYLLASVVPIVVLQWWRGIPQPTFGQQVEVIGASFAVALPLAVLWCFASVPASRAPPPAHLSWGEFYRILGRNRPFLRLLTAYALDRISMGVYLAVMPFLVTHALGLMQYFLEIALVISVASVVFTPLWVVLARRLGKHRTYVLANVLTCAAYGLLFVVPAGNLVAVLAAYVVLGLGNAGTLILPPSMTADAVDYDHLKSGAPQAGGHMSFLAFVFKAGMAGGVFVGTLVLGVFGFSGNVPAAQQSPQALLGVRVGVALVPIALLLPSMLMMWRYPLDARRHRTIRIRLERLADMARTRRQQQG
jgi:Na+/melibiose symporter-like transporter